MSEFQRSDLQDTTYSKRDSVCSECNSDNSVALESRITVLRASMTFSLAPEILKMKMPLLFMLMVKHFILAQKDTVQWGAMMYLKL